MTPQVDLTLGLNPQAWAVLHLLAGYEIENFAPDAELYTWPWYNGRERGFVLALTPMAGGRALCVAFAEVRGGDTLFVAVWERFSIHGYMGDQPHWKDAEYDNAHQHAQEFVNPRTAVEYIVGRMESWWQREESRCEHGYLASDTLPCGQCK